MKAVKSTSQNVLTDAENAMTSVLNTPFNWRLCPFLGIWSKCSGMLKLAESKTEAGEKT